jgi:hypothetical protein
LYFVTIGLLLQLQQLSITLESNHLNFYELRTYLGFIGLILTYAIEITPRYIVLFDHFLVSLRAEECFLYDEDVIGRLVDLLGVVIGEFSQRMLVGGSRDWYESSIREMKFFNS